ncbi:MAG: OmcA/MtrC family decaheme c-type cytochrome [Bryobacterales bacterium]|nr:OmcA/MtrC family decaheme c-type cytochrome [Bryobacterales bacterium]
MLSKRYVLLLLACVAIIAAWTATANERAQLFRPSDKAFYLDERSAAFIRPGLTMKVTRAEIATDGTIRAWVRLTDSRGQGLDRAGIETPGAIAVSFLIGYIPNDATRYVSYITRQRTAGSNTVTQATGENNGTWQRVALGDYIYTFSNKVPTNIDRNATHTVGIYGSRNLTEFELGTNRDDDAFHFVPSGGAVTKVRDVVRTSSCNKCHDQLAFHGGNRRSVEVCNICHTPQTPDSTTGNTLDMTVMTHKIHMGRNLPSVVAKGKYQLGNVDYSTVGNPSPAMACGACHEPQRVSGATQADNWMNKPTREACGSCHDNVNFATGANHAAGPAFNDNQCATCHAARGELDFDASVSGAHTVPTKSSLLSGIQFTIDAVDDAAPGKNPIVTFTVKDRDGAPVPVSRMTNARIYMAGPTTDIPSYVREDVRASQGPGDGRYFFTFATPIPADARGSWQFGIEGYRTTDIFPGTTKARQVRDVGTNKVVAVTVDGSPMQKRRAIVSNQKCNACHYSMSFHGGNRNTVEMCTFCHNANLVEDGVSWNFVNMIHRVHAEEVRYPGALANCTQCHEGNTYTLPIAKGLKATANGKAPLNPTPPITNACLSCHNETTAWQHAAANISALGESCETCHGRGREFDAAKVHAQ